MNNAKKYQTPTGAIPASCSKWVQKTAITKPPVWCSMDLRGGNHALIEPMTLGEKTEYFRMLCKIGFREIEISSPAASTEDFSFTRELIEENLIPEDVTIQVLTGANEEDIYQTFASLEGAKKANVHFYTPMSAAYCEQVLHMSPAQMKQATLDCAALIKTLAEASQPEITMEYTMEYFNQTELSFALEVCDAVMDVWQPTPEHKAILNLCETVESMLPHVFASQVAYIHQHLKKRDSVILSVHCHNDRGCAVAATELAILAGAERVEGALFGNGERTGNSDLVTLAMNLFAHGVDPQLDFSDLMKNVETYERLTGMHVFERAPYAGNLVFSAFSATYQDAIAKGFRFRESQPDDVWNVPYLPIDPSDVGRSYESDVIRINSSSGTGGIAYILKRRFGLQIPDQMKPELRGMITHLSALEHREMMPELVYGLFCEKYVTNTPVFTIPHTSFTMEEDRVKAENSIVLSSGNQFLIRSEGNGRLDAVSNALKKYFDTSYELEVYEEHALTTGSTSKAVSYVCISTPQEKHWGVGIDEDIIRSSIDALVVAVNQLGTVQDFQVDTDPRIIEMIDYIRDHYLTVTLEELSAQFFLSKQYISKYIRDKSGATFCENVQKVRMKKAETLLATTDYTVEKVAELSGYPSVEHFNRRFKMLHGLTPVQYRNQQKNT